MKNQIKLRSGQNKILNKIEKLDKAQNRMLALKKSGKLKGDQQFEQFQTLHKQKHI